MTRKSERERDRADSLVILRRLLPPGSEVCTLLRHRARSGMYRRITLLIATLDDDRNFRGKGKPPQVPTVTDITFHVARVLDYPIKGRAGYVQDVGLGVGGAGMDMGFHLANSLSYALHGHGREGDPEIPEPHRAGYTLRHRWI